MTVQHDVAASDSSRVERGSPITAGLWVGAGFALGLVAFYLGNQALPIATQRGNQTWLPIMAAVILVALVIGTALVARRRPAAAVGLLLGFGGLVVWGSSWGIVMMGAPRWMSGLSFSSPVDLVRYTAVSPFSLLVLGILIGTLSGLLRRKLGRHPK